MNDEFPRRPARDAEPDQHLDFGFGGEPLFRDEVSPAGAVPGPRATGFHDPSLFRDPAGAAENGPGLDYGSGGDYGTGILSGFGAGADAFSSSDGFPARGFAGPGDAAGTTGAGTGRAYGAEPVPGADGEPQWGSTEGPLRVVPADQASALLRIKLPEAPPVPATTLRSDAPIAAVVEAAQMLHHVSPARPNALPGDVLALTTATMVVPMPGAAFGGVGTLQRSARLTASVPPDLASRAEADLLSDTVEQFFGDFDAIGQQLEAQRASAAGAAAGAGSAPTQPAPVPGQYARATPPPGARYGVPTQFPGYDAARRSPVGMRYLGGIFHDSSGESSFYDPATESLVPMGAAAFSAADFRRTAPAVARPVPAPRAGTRASAPSADSHEVAYDDETQVLSTEHWADHHPDHHRSRRRRRGRAALVSALAVGLAFGALYGAALAFEGQVPSGTVVDGVGIGGLSRTAAEAKLATMLGPRLTAPIRLTAGGTTFQLLPDQAGLHLDYAGTVAAAMAGRSDPTVAIPALAGRGRAVSLRVSVDSAALRTALANATAGFDKPMVDGGVVFPGGVPTPIAPHPGRQVDLDAAVDAVASAFHHGVASVHSVHSAAMADKGSGGGTFAMASAGYAVPGALSFPASPIALVVHDIQPTVTPATVAQAMEDLARPAMSGPVVLNTGSVRTVLKPAILGRHLAIDPDGRGGLVPKLDGVGVRGEIDRDALARLEQPAVDAAFTVSAGRPVLVPGKNGVGYAPAAIQNAVLPVLTKTTVTQRTVTVPIGPLPPALTTEAAQALGVRDVMGTYTAPFTAAAQRTANVKHAADLLHGRILQPGQVFSLNLLLGPRSAVNGFIPAAASAGSSAPSQDAGAGTSLVATALFDAEYLAGLKDVEHHPHATVMDHFPPGMEAAVSYPDVDLRFQNDSGAAVYLWTAATDNAVTVAVLGQKAYDSVQTETSPHYAMVQPKTLNSLASSCVPSDGVPGFQVDVTRILTKAGQEPVRQLFHTAYAAQDKVICGDVGAGAGPTSGGAPTAGPAGLPTGGTTPSPDPPSATPTGGASGGSGGSGGPTGAPTGTPSGTASSAGWDGSLLGGLLGAPSSRH